MQLEIVRKIVVNSFWLVPFSALLTTNALAPLGSARFGTLRLGKLCVYEYIPGGEGDYMSMIMFIFHFIKSCDDDDDDDECFVCPTCHAVTLNLCNFLKKCWVKKSLTARNWYFQLILSILLVYFVEFLFGFGINLILLFNQMHCTTQM